jgi:anti-sigma factor RsiW
MTNHESPIGEDDLHAYVDRRLPQDRIEKVEAYLKSNPDVAAQVSAWRMQRETLRDQLASKAAEPIPARLRISNIRAIQRQDRLRQLGGNRRLDGKERMAGPQWRARRNGQ